MKLRSLTARAFPLALVALTGTAACSGSESEGPGGNAGGSAGESGASGAGAGGKAGASGTGGAAQGGSGGSGTGGTAQGGSGSGGGGGGGELCADRTGGALIEFGVVDDTITVWIENEAFITEAQRLLAADETRVPVFNTLVDGGDCDAQWSWHPDPNDVEFADFTIELCDGLPSYIEQNKQEWFDTVGNWCPWSAVVVSVTER